MKIPNWQHHSKKEKKRHLKPQALRAAQKRLQASALEIQSVYKDLKVIQSIIKSPSIKKSIIESSKESDLLVLGASVNGVLDKARLGNIQESIARESKGSVLTIRAPEGRVKRWLHRLLDDE